MILDSKQSEALANKYGSFPKQLQMLKGEQCSPMKMLETVNASKAWKQWFQHLNCHKIDINCYEYEHIFSWKLAIQSLIDSPSPTHISCMKNCPHNLTKYEIKGTSKIPISRLFSELGKIWKYSLS